ncbi:hypothetical protein Thermo_01680 [Thermoplasmatales archaeon]|nr:hypothetical protein Thermo_01680 [Thermoplasmatales archaeon]
MLQGDPKADLKKTQIFETIAWTLMKNYSIQGTVVMYGRGGEGKSIIHKVVENLLVRTSSITLEELEEDKFKRAELYGSWANLISESSFQILSSEWFKRVTDGTTITVDRKNGHPFKFASHAKQIIDTNELPDKENELRAFYRRVIDIIDFPNVLEDVMIPEQIKKVVEKLEDKEELDRIFSYVIDNYYGPLTTRMKFTGQLNLNEAKKEWEKRSNPALAYLRLLNDNEIIITDIEDARVIIEITGRDPERYITGSYKGSFDEYLTTPKQEVITAAVKWATEKGFPIKNINAASIGKALNTLGYSNPTVDKRIGTSGSRTKAWCDLLNVTWMPVAETVSDLENGPRQQKGQSEINPDTISRGSSFADKNFYGKHEHEEGKRVSTTDESSTLGNANKKVVSGDSERPATDPRLEKKGSQPKPDNSDIRDDRG